MTIAEYTERYDIQDKVMRVFELCYRISNETNHQAFFEYAPHVDSIFVQVFDGGWTNDKKPIYSIEVYTDDRFKSRITVSELITKLMSILKEGVKE